MLFEIGRSEMHAFCLFLLCSLLVLLWGLELEGGSDGGSGVRWTAFEEKDIEINM